MLSTLRSSPRSFSLGSSRLRSTVALSTLLIFSLVIFLYTSEPTSWPLAMFTPHVEYTPLPYTPAREREAYATFLASRPNKNPWREDLYFNSTRMLVFQLLHNPKIRDGRAVVVMVNKHVEDWKRKQLTEDGAIVKVVDDVPLSFPLEGYVQPRYVDTFTKFRLWELEEYSRILYVDADIVIIRPLAEIWGHKSSRPSPVLGEKFYKATQKEHDIESNVLSKVPSYIFGAYTDSGWGGKDYLNSGIFMLGPNKSIYNHLVSTIKHHDVYGGAKFPDQNVLNWVFRLNGPMPWRIMPHDRVENHPTDKKVEKGLLMLHEKFWEIDPKVNRRVKEFAEKVQERMDGYYDCKYKIA